VGADGELWWGSNNSPQVGEIQQTSNTVAVYNLGTPAGGVAPSPQFMVSASDENIWVTDANNDAVFRVVGTGVSKGTSTYTILPQGESFNPFPEGITEGGDHKLYVGSEYIGSTSLSGYLDGAAPAKSPVFSSIGLPAVGSFPYIFAPFKTKIYYNDFIWDGLGSYESSTGELVILPLRNPTGASGSGGIADELAAIVAKMNKYTGAQIIYHADPDALIAGCIEAYRAGHYRRSSTFVEKEPA